MRLQSLGGKHSSNTWLPKLTHDRWFYGVFAFTLGVGFIGVIFFGLETRFARPPTSIDGQIVYTDEFGATRVLSDEQAKAALAEIGNLQDNRNINHDIRKKTFLQTLDPWPGKTPHGLSIAGRSFLRMLLCFTSPGVLYAILAGAVTMGQLPFPSPFLRQLLTRS